MSWETKNAQTTIQERRPPQAEPIKPISEVAAALQPDRWYDGIYPSASSDIDTSHVYQLTRLDNFQFQHLEPKQQKTLQMAISKAKDWSLKARVTKGLSFIMCGPVGVGKTTIAENLMRDFRQPMNITHPMDEEYLDLLQAAASKLQEGDPNRIKLEQMIAEHSPQQANISNGMLYDSTRLMGILKSESVNMRANFGRYEVIIVDDAGLEEIDYSNQETEIIKRQKRYGRLIEYCYRNGIHLIITSNTPLYKEMGSQKAPNPDFVAIFGLKAFSRLHQMAHGYMCDMSGLPDYRPFMVSGS
jgi:DNA replication protein DnaC